MCVYAPFHDPSSALLCTQEFGLGSIPLRFGGIKSYDTPDDEVVLEIPLLWGSDAKVSPVLLKI